MATTGRTGKDLFALIDGVPAGILVILGILLVLLGALLPRYVAAAADADISALDLAQRIMDLDIAAIRDQQDSERAAQAAAAAAGQVVDPNAETRRQETLRAQTQQLKVQYRIAELRRGAVAASASVHGLRSHLFLDWAGRLLLLIGLFAMTVSADGTRQKVLGVVLVVVLLFSLGGLRFGLDAGAGVGGGSGPGVELRLPDAPAPASTPTLPTP